MVKRKKKGWGRRSVPKQEYKAWNIVCLCVCENMYIAKNKGKSCVCYVPYDNDSQNYVFFFLFYFVLVCVFFMFKKTFLVSFKRQIERNLQIICFFIVYSWSSLLLYALFPICSFCQLYSPLFLLHFFDVLISQYVIFII